MTKPVIVDDAALRELERGARWYDQERAGLGDELVDKVDAIFDALPTGKLHALRIPGLSSEPPVRRVFVERFPYAVIFAETDTAFHVVAVAHSKRRPCDWRGRLKRALRTAPKKP